MSKGWGDEPRYTLDAAWKRKLIPWPAATARKYMRERSPGEASPFRKV
ncbi:hypothetical protein ACFVYE_18805 [Streptomyces sp. NPDC058239]